MQRVLIVDDSKFARANHTKLLQKLEYEVVGEAEDGLVGLEMLQKLEPDLIITDLEMPNLDGIGMIKEIRSYNNDVKIVVVSSVVNAQSTLEVMKLRAVIIKKPIKEHKLLNAIKLLNR